MHPREGKSFLVRLQSLCAELPSSARSLEVQANTPDSFFMICGARGGAACLEDRRRPATARSAWHNWLVLGNPTCTYREAQRVEEHLHHERRTRRVAAGPQQQEPAERERGAGPDEQQVVQLGGQQVKLEDAEAHD